MSHLPRGFPSHFPVRDVNARAWRYKVLSRIISLAIHIIYVNAYTIEGLENVPDDGPYLLVPNHLSNLDPVLFGGVFRQTLFAMGKREMFFHPWLAWMWAGCNTFPVDRGHSDRWAIRMGSSILAAGGRLLIFVEGTRSRSGTMAKAAPGVGFLVRHCSIPVIPVALWGTEKAWPPGKLLPHRSHWHMRVGPMIPVDDLLAGATNSEEISIRVAHAIAAMLPPAYRGVYADVVATPDAAIGTTKKD